VLYPVEVFVRSRCAIRGSFLFSVLFAVTQLSVFATGSVTLAWNACTDPNVAGYNVYYGGASGAYTNEICAGNATNATISGLVEEPPTILRPQRMRLSGMGKSVLKRGVLSGSPECSDCCSDCELFKHLYRRCLHKPFPVQDKHAAVWEKIVGPLPPIYTNLVFTGFWNLLSPIGVWTLHQARTC